jgi:hypothetical protein
VTLATAGFAASMLISGVSTSALASNAFSSYGYYSVGSTTYENQAEAATYEKNANGLTYGSALRANSPADEPDLIQTAATNGAVGYVYKRDLDKADGNEAAKGFTSPADALAWQATEGRRDHTIPVYTLDGVTVIGEFVVLGGDHQARPDGR